MERRAILIDKDGTLIPDIPYNVNPDLISLEDGAEELKVLQEMGFLLVIVSNQSGVARGYFPESELKKVEDRITFLLQKNHVQLHGFFYCPHHPDGSVPAYSIRCKCRKPGNEMLLKAAKSLQFDLTRSWMIGDILNDVEAGNKAGCKTILIDNGNETEWIEGTYRTPAYKTKNLREAINIIKKESFDLI